MRLKLQNNRESIFQGAIQGAMVWTVYGVVECWFSSILPWFVKPHYEYIPSHWGFTVLLFAVYSAFGLILGGFCALSLRGLSGKKTIFKRFESEELFLPFMTFTIILAFDIKLIVQLPFSISVLHILPPLFISVILAVALTFSVWSRVWFERLRFLANPWTASLLLLGLPWMTVELLKNETRATNAWSILAYLVLILFLSFLVQKVMRAYRFAQSTETTQADAKRVLFLVSVVLIFIRGKSLFTSGTSLDGSEGEAIN